MGKISREIGNRAEEKAAKYLQDLCYEIIERNFHSRFGEIDIIAQKDGVLHFVEVKASLVKNPLENITLQKMQKLQKTIRFFLYSKRIELPYQMDAIVLHGDKIELIENISI